MKTIFCLLLILIPSTAFSSDLTGRYRYIAMMPKSICTNDKIEYSQIKTVFSLELRDDKGLRYSVTTEGDSSDLSHFKGVWTINGDRLFYLLKSPGWYFVGSSKVHVLYNSLELSSFLGPPLAPKREMLFIRDESVKFPFDIAADMIPIMRNRLDKIIKNIPEVKFVGAETQEELKRKFYSAIKTEDVSKLLALTYIRQNEYIDDPALNYYLNYVSEFLRPGEYQIEETSGEKFLQFMKKFELQFPKHISPKGFFMMMKKVGANKSGIAWFYGVVEDRWALIGPYIK